MAHGLHDAKHCSLGASRTALSMKPQIEKILEEAGQPVPPELRQYAQTSRGDTSFRSRGRGGGGGGGSRGGGFGGGGLTGSNNIPVGSSGGGGYGGGGYGGYR